MNQQLARGAVAEVESGCRQVLAALQQLEAGQPDPMLRRRIAYALYDLTHYQQQLGRPDEAMLIIDGSQSGQWRSPHYRDLHEVWLRGEYITADMDEPIPT